MIRKKSNPIPMPEIDEDLAVLVNDPAGFDTELPVLVDDPDIFELVPEYIVEGLDPDLFDESGSVIERNDPRHPDYDPKADYSEYDPIDPTEVDLGVPMPAAERALLEATKTNDRILALEEQVSAAVAAMNLMANAMSDMAAKADGTIEPLGRAAQVLGPTKEKA